MTLSELQQKITQLGFDAYIVTRNNQFLKQDILEAENRLYQLTGFSGSAGNLLVFPEKAILFVDGRYELQAAQQVDTTKIEVVVTNGASLATWMHKNLSGAWTVGYNPWCHPINEVEYWNRSLKNIRFVEDTQNLSGALTSGVDCNIFEHDIEFAGITMDEKISMFTKFMSENKLDAYLITACDAVSWLLNLRSDCLPDSPIVRAYALINSLGEVSLFTTDFAKLENELDHYKGKTIGTAFNQTPSAIFNLMKKRKIWLNNMTNPIMLWKAVKNPVELAGFKAAHLRDGIAMVRFLIWFEENYNGKSELDIVAKLREFRQTGTNFFSNSFETIAGFGPNGAIVHYQPQPNTNLSLQDGSLLLLDSGAQYYDGTTDITRTLAVGQPSANMVRDFTVVLKSHIALASAYFPKGTTGQSLDSLARAPLWKYGITYNHGTGHGVGFFLNVHEGPHSISSHGGTTALMENMVTSIEPGCYKENQYGIRIENLVYITPVEDSSLAEPMLKFSPLTLVPLDKQLIDKYLLTAEERAWVDAYHQTVFQTLSPHLTAAECQWLEKACSPL